MLPGVVFQAGLCGGAFCWGVVFADSDNNAMRTLAWVLLSVAAGVMLYAIIKTRPAR